MSASLGKYIGECMGFGFFEAHIKDGTLDHREKPAEFTSEEDAQEYLDSWIGGPADCKVVGKEEK